MFILSALALPLAIFFLAVVRFAWTTEEFGPRDLFPLIFVASTLFVVAGILSTSLNDPSFFYRVADVLGLSFTIMMSGLICGIIAIKQRFGW